MNPFHVFWNLLKNKRLTINRLEVPSLVLKEHWKGKNEFSRFRCETKL